jgi:hypothetical protein
LTALYAILRRKGAASDRPAARIFRWRKKDHEESFDEYTHHPTDQEEAGRLPCPD